jgi:hypothetical protein
MDSDVMGVAYIQIQQVDIQIAMVNLLIIKMINISLFSW